MRVEDSLKDKNMAPAVKRKAMFLYVTGANRFCPLQNKRQCPTTMILFGGAAAYSVKGKKV